DPGRAHHPRQPCRVAPADDRHPALRGHVPARAAPARAARLPRDLALRRQRGLRGHGARRGRPGRRRVRLTRAVGSPRPRVALLGLYHESNTFAPAITGDDAFALHRGAGLVEAFAGTSTAVGGFLEVGGAELVPLSFGLANPSGTIAGPTFARLLEELLAPLRRGGPWDAVLLALHGAAVAETELDADGMIVERVREAVGAAVPGGVCLDMHANLSLRTIERSTVAVLYRTNPHLDAADRARECGELVLHALRGEVTPVQALLRVPLVVNILRQGTSTSPLREVVAEVEAAESAPGVLSASLALGFPYADVPELGVTCVGGADGDERLAREAAGRRAPAA